MHFSRPMRGVNRGHGRWLYTKKSTSSKQLHKLTLHQDLTFKVCFCRVSESSSSSCQSAAVLQTLVPSSHSKSNIFTLTLLWEMWKTPSIRPFDTYVEFWRQKCAWIKRTSKANSWSAFIRSIQGKFMPNVFKDERREEFKHEREHIPHQPVRELMYESVWGSQAQLGQSCTPVTLSLLSYSHTPVCLSI